MSDFAQSLAVSASGLQAQAKRLRVVSENIANTDTPGYHRKTIEFRAEDVGADTASGVQVHRIGLDRSELERVFDPSHPMAGEDGYFEASNVDLILEIADSREAQRTYEANLKMFEQARQMSQGLMDLLRR